MNEDITKTDNSSDSEGTKRRLSDTKRVKIDSTSPNFESFGTTTNSSKKQRPPKAKLRAHLVKNQDYIWSISLSDPLQSGETISLTVDAINSDSKFGKCYLLLPDTLTGNEGKELGDAWERENIKHLEKLSGGYRILRWNTAIGNTTDDFLKIQKGEEYADKERLDRKEKFDEYHKFFKIAYESEEKEYKEFQEAVDHDAERYIKSIVKKRKSSEEKDSNNSIPQNGIDYLLNEYAGFCTLNTFHRYHYEVYKYTRSKGFVEAGKLFQSYCEDMGYAFPDSISFNISGILETVVDTGDSLRCNSPFDTPDISLLAKKKSASPNFDKDASSSDEEKSIGAYLRSPNIEHDDNHFEMTQPYTVSPLSSPDLLKSDNPQPPPYFSLTSLEDSGRQTPPIISRISNPSTPGSQLSLKFNQFNVSPTPDSKALTRGTLKKSTSLGSLKGNRINF